MASPTRTNRTVVHVSPHPDDEVLGSPGALLLLRAAGWTVINFIATMGRREDRERRAREAASASEAAGFILETPAEPIGLSGSDDLRLGFELVRLELASLLADVEPSLVVAPSPHDAHHAHEVVSRAAIQAVQDCPSPPRLWMWGLWGDLPFPTVLAPFGEDVLALADEVLSCYAGEVGRNDYRALLASRSRANAILGAERVFGFGAQGNSKPFADLLTECFVGPDGWTLAEPRLINPPAEPMPCHAEQTIEWWLGAPSPSELRRQGVATPKRASRDSVASGLGRTGQL